MCVIFENCFAKIRDESSHLCLFSYSQKITLQFMPYILVCIGQKRKGRRKVLSMEIYNKLENKTIFLL